MKKILTTLVLLPLLTACSGMPVSREDSLVILQNIENNLANVISTSYTVTAKTKSEDVETEVVYIYSKENKFYHTYTITTQSTGRISESWRFKQTYEYANSDETADFIFAISRSITPSNINDLEKQYVVTYEKYSDSAWDKYASDYEDRLARRYSDGIEHSRELIKDLTASVDLKSFNSTSLFLNSKETTVGVETQTNEYEISFSNVYLSYIKTTSGKTTVDTTFKYSTGDVMYPAFKISIPYNA